MHLLGGLHSVNEPTSKLHNYILKDCIPIEETDIVYKDYVPNPCDDIIPDGEIVELTDYHKPKRPSFEEGLDELLKLYS